MSWGWENVAVPLSSPIRTGAGVTVTANVADVVFPDASDTEQVTVDVPTENVAPDEGEQSTGRLPSTRSAALAENVTDAPAGLVAWTVMSSGSTRIGAVVSSTVTVNCADAVFP